MASYRLVVVNALYEQFTDSRGSQRITSIQALLRKYERHFPKSETNHDSYRLYAGALLRALAGESSVECELWNSSTTNKQTQWGLIMEESGVFALGYYAPDLLTTAYAAFAHLMTNKQRMKTCAGGCGTLFRPKSRSDQEWCREGYGSTTRAQKRRSRAGQD